MLISLKEKQKKPIFLFLDVTDMVGNNRKVQWRPLLILSKNIVPDNIFFNCGPPESAWTPGVVASIRKYAAFPSSSWTWQNTTHLKLGLLPYIKSQIIPAWFIFSSYPVHTRFVIKRDKFRSIICSVIQFPFELMEEETKHWHKKKSSIGWK